MSSSPGELVFPGDGEMAKLMRAKRWDLTSLGPIEGWSATLRTAIRIVLTSRFSMWMGWGDDLVFFYNDAYRADTLGAKHPRVLGIPTREAWSEIWTEIGPRIANVLTEGRATWDEGLLLFLERDGYREETYHTFSYSPLHDDDGRVRGVLCVVSEDTARVIGERRVGLLGGLAAELSGAKTADDVVSGLERGLARDPRDLPFTLSYLFDANGTTARLASQTGFPAGHPGAPPTLEIARSPWRIGELLDAASSGLAGFEVELDGAIGAPLAWPSGPWQIAPSRAFVMPIAQAGQSRPAGVFITGINPQRVFDAAYRELVTLVVGQLAAAFANANAYEAEHRRAESLAELDRAKTAFFSNVSHEFRTPLTLMLGPLDGVLADAGLAASAPGIRDQLEAVHRNGLRLLKLVNTMLDFSRIEAGRTTARFVPTDLAQLTTDLASVFRAAIDKAGLRLIVDCAPLDELVRVDRDMWEKIVLNLVSNAFKFTLEGEIGVALARHGDRVDLVVRDTGSGIPPEELPRVFERFHRVEGTRGRTYEGTGIGLALVQELVRLHGGTIGVTSSLGRGSTFTVSIPLRVEDDPSVAPQQPARAPGAPQHAEATAFVEEALRWLPDGIDADRAVAGAESRAGAGGERAHLLIADDNADMRDYLRRLLGERWRVETVANGAQALDAMRARRPDLMVTDVMMPELDGFGLLAAMRGDPALRDLPVIMLSARAGEDAQIEGLQAGASDYLSKPFAARELIARVETQLLRAAMRSAEAVQARRLAMIFEQAPMAVAILRGSNHVFEVANAPYRRFFADRPVVGLRLADALPEVVSQGIVELLDRVIQTGEPFIGRSMRLEMQRVAGGPLQETFFDLTYQPLFDGDGRTTGIAAVGHDVTALATARRDAETANRAKDEFLAMLGHELRNPLAPIMTALELMRQRPEVGGERERAVIERQVQHLVGLVDDLLDVSRITRGKVELRTEAVEIAEIVSRSVEVVSPLLEQHRHILTVDVPHGMYVHGDAARLAQVLSNLLTNAAKYTPKHGQIAVRAWREDGRAMIRVSDNGVGIEPAMLQRVFEPFAQERQSIERAQGGLGLGLAIVDNLVKLHGGSVTAVSGGRGQGSELTVSLPLTEIPLVVRAATRAPASPAIGERRILIIDDNIDAAQMLAELLEAGGYRTLAAHDGPSALDAVRAFQPQVAVVDLGLPVMDGFELARHLLEHAGPVTTRLVALTGYGQAQDRARTAAAGFEAHLVKPVDIDQLRNVIEQLLPRSES